MAVLPDPLPVLHPLVKPIQDSFPDPEGSKRLFTILDRAFLAVTDGAFADAALRSGSHLLCRPGCSQCCTGVFAIGPADRLRAAAAIQKLEQTDAQRAARVKQRAQDSWQRLAPDFPGDLQGGILMQGADDAFEAFGNEEVCPALDPESGTCDIYEERPHLCRVFGPPLPVSDGFSVCDLCFTHASPEEVAAAALAADPADTAETLETAACAAGAADGETILAFVLRGSIPI